MVNRFVIVFCVALTLRAQSGWQSLAHAGQLTREGQFDEARRIVQSSVDQPPGSAGVAQLAGALNDLGALCQDLGSNRDASWYYLKSVSLWNRAPYGPGFTVTLVNFATLHQHEGRLGEAQKLYQRAIEILTAHAELDSAQAADIYNGLAELASLRGRNAEAEDYARRALAIGERCHIPGRAMGMALFHLGAARRARGQLAEAESFLRRAIEVWEKSLGRDHQTTASGMAYLAAIVSKSVPSEAERLFAEALQVYERALGAFHSETGVLLGHYAKHLRSQGRKSEARPLELRSAAIAERHKYENPGLYSVDLSALRSRSR